MTLHPALERHGDDWSVDIDHDAGCFVSVARNFRSGGAER